MSISRLLVCISTGDLWCIIRVIVKAEGHGSRDGGGAVRLRIAAVRGGTGRIRVLQSAIGGSAGRAG